MKLIALLFLLFLTSPSANAYSSDSQSSLASPTEHVMKFSKQMERELARRKVKVALVARTGRADNELPKGVTYTHVGFAVYSSFKDANGADKKGYVMHNLYQNQDQPNVSNLVRDFPFDFFSQAMVLKAGIIIPTNEVQDRILQVLNSKVYTALHNPNYSAISNPFNNKYQNCTEFVLNILQSAIYDVSDMKIIKRSLQDYYQPYNIRVNRFAIVMGALFSREIAIGDHKNGYKTSTFTSIENYMQEFQLSEQSFVMAY